MASSARRRPSSTRNPFDSSDDEDEVKKHVVTSSQPYSNPFDNGEDDNGPASTSQTLPRHLPTHGYAKNPFDDDDGVAVPPKPAREPSLKAKLDQGTLFDEPPRFSNQSPGMSDERKTKMKSPVESALKKAQKLKDAGANQASKLVEGGFQQAQRLRESRFSAFKTSNGSSDVKPNKPFTSSQARNQLLSGEKGSGRHGVCEKGSSFDDNRHGLYDNGSFGSSTSQTGRYDDRQFHGANLEHMSMQELEDYSVQKSEDTTKCIQNCRKVVEDIKGDATRTLVNLNQQGEQIRRTHELAYDMDQSLTAGEKLLGSLGGMLSRTWKPKKAPAVKGPVEDATDYELRKKGHHREQRTALGLDAKGQTTRPSDDVQDSHAETTQAKLELEQKKQDDALSDLSNVLDQIKEMSVDMGSEIARQNFHLENLQNDVLTLDGRVKGANARGRRLLGR